ncbi:MAG TPA: hypothetical protein VMV92_23315 [Streptosporangiaceae bacterium]|nr:hypothetical protein [Streptosporangiaceae bacterium]
MSWQGASSGDMTEFPYPGLVGRELDESVLDALLDGQCLPVDVPEQACVVAEMLTSLAGPAEPGELAGETAARSAFTRRPYPAGVSGAGRPARQRRSWLRAPCTGLAAALVTAAAGLGGAAAAYVGVLPGPIQNFAHNAIGAPPARHASLHRPPGRQITVRRPDGGPTSPAASQPTPAPGKAKVHAKPVHPAHPAHPPKPVHPAHPKARRGAARGDRAGLPGGHLGNARAADSAARSARPALRRRIRGAWPRIHGSPR